MSKPGVVVASRAALRNPKAVFVFIGRPGYLDTLNYAKIYKSRAIARRYWSEDDYMILELAEARALLAVRAI
jgi:hypothetical protein